MNIARIGPRYLTLKEFPEGKPGLQSNTQIIIGKREIAWRTSLAGEEIGRMRGGRTGEGPDRPI